MKLILSEASIEDTENTTTLLILTRHEHLPEAGGDTIIVRCPPQFIPARPESPGIDVNLQLMLGKIAEEQEEQMGLILRGSAWWVTRDPEVVRQRGLVHDCEHCRQGVERAIMQMTEDMVVAVGFLSWA